MSGYTVRLAGWHDRSFGLEASSRYCESEYNLSYARPDRLMLDRLVSCACRRGQALVLQFKSQPIGFLQFKTYTLPLAPIKVVENLYLYIAPEHRSYVAFRALIEKFISTGAELNCAEARLVFDGSWRHLALARLARRSGFSVIGSILRKSIQCPTIVCNRDPLACRRPGLKSLIYLLRITGIDFRTVFYLAYEQTFRRHLLSPEDRIYQIGDVQKRFSGGLFLVAFCDRAVDGVRITLVQGINSPSRGDIEALERTAIANKSSEIIVNTSLLGHDERVVFPSYFDAGFSIIGFRTALKLKS
jgi:hypothetical protein